MIIPAVFEQLKDTKTIEPLFEIEPVVELGAYHWELLFFDNGMLIFFTRLGMDERIKVCTIAAFEKYYIFADHPVFKKVE